MKKKLFLLTFLFLSILVFKKYSTQTLKPVNAYLNETNKYKENIYKANVYNINSNQLFSYIKDFEIDIIEIKPIIYKGINKVFYTKGDNTNEILFNFINEYTMLLNQKGYTEESIYIKEKGINIEYIKVLAIEKELQELNNKIRIEYSIEK